MFSTAAPEHDKMDVSGENLGDQETFIMAVVYIIIGTGCYVMSSPQNIFSGFIQNRAESRSIMKNQEE